MALDDDIALAPSSDGALADRAPPAPPKLGAIAARPTVCASRELWATDGTLVAQSRQLGLRLAPIT